jgi:hypothetical protein
MQLTLASLKDERWLLRETGSGGRQMVEAHFASEGFMPRIAMALGSNEAIKHAWRAAWGLRCCHAMRWAVIRRRLDWWSCQCRGFRYREHSVLCCARGGDSPLRQRLFYSLCENRRAGYRGHRYITPKQPS